MATTEFRGPGIVWHTFPLGVLGADQTGADRTCHATLRDLTAWLPHVSALGADTLLLGPVFASLSHGYDTVTHHEVDERIGTAADLDALVAAAAEQGVGVVLDGVFAYASRAFRRLDGWFRRDARGELVPWRVESLVTPDYGSAGYQAYVADVMSHWLRRGITGWRLDSAWSVPSSFWRPVLTRVRAEHPRAWLLGQVFDDDLPPVVNGAGWSSVTEYALMHGTREWLAGGSVDRMVATLRVHEHNSTRNPVHTFLGNHDVARLADVLPAEQLLTAFTLLMTLPGVPGIYYGDELAVRSRWQEGGSDALLRPALTPPTGDSELLTRVRELGRYRRANPWLTSATLDDIGVQDGAIHYRVRGDGNAIRVRVDPAVPSAAVEEI
jgi:cyclomaltodextrinase / maltogenic alpha-amylase / neopullulanase